MGRMHDVFARLPERAFVWVDSTYGGAIGVVVLGQHGYTPYVGPHTLERLKLLNAELGVTGLQSDAMKIGSQYGYHVPGVEDALNGDLPV